MDGWGRAQGSSVHAPDYPSICPPVYPPYDTLGRRSTEGARGGAGTRRSRLQPGEYPISSRGIMNVQVGGPTGMTIQRSDDPTIELLNHEARGDTLVLYHVKSPVSALTRLDVCAGQKSHWLTGGIVGVRGPGPSPGRGGRVRTPGGERSCPGTEWGEAGPDRLAARPLGRSGRTGGGGVLPAGRGRGSGALASRDPVSARRVPGPRGLPATGPPHPLRCRDQRRGHRRDEHRPVVGRSSREIGRWMSDVRSLVH